MPSNDTNAILMLQGITKYYGPERACNDVTLSIKEGELLTILGPSGSGKSTLLRIISGFLRPDSGKVILDGNDITNVHPSARNISILFQKPLLFPHMTVFDNLAFPLRTKRHRVTEAKIKVLVDEMLSLVKLERANGKYPRQLSGGQEQRIALMRSLIFKPKIVLLDEPLGAIDRIMREALQYELRTIQLQLHVTMLYVTHDQGEALSISDRIAILNEGALQQVDEPTALLKKPCNVFTAKFVGYSNMISTLMDNQSMDVQNRDLLKSIAAALIGRNTPPSRGFMITVLFRPESLRISSATDEGIPFSGEIVEKTFFGGYWRLTVRTKSGHLIVAHSPDIPRLVHYSVGNYIELNCCTEDMLIFTDMKAGGQL